MLGTGKAAYAEANALILLFPQASVYHHHPPSHHSQNRARTGICGQGMTACRMEPSLRCVLARGRYGAFGADCWDWSGETGAAFDTREGAQLSAVIAMVQGLDRIVNAGVPMPSSWPPIDS